MRLHDDLVRSTHGWSVVDTMACAGVGVFAAVGLMAYGVASSSSQIFGPSIFHGDRTKRSIALTFDDGPSPGTSRLLEVLDRHQVPATFFQCGANVLRHPEIAREVVAAGHEIGNHTFSHARLCPRLGWKLNLMSRANVFQEFATAQQVIEEVTGVRARYLRAPYGLRWFGLDAVQRQFDLLGVMWTVIGHDWEWQSKRITDLVVRRASPGGIICLHDGRDIQVNPDISETVAAVGRMIPILKDQGYRFETVTKLRGEAISA
jgi:peptidoglycan/xylan/chitin deacetylase (PgdA/CDA1 family)